VFQIDDLMNHDESISSPDQRPTKRSHALRRRLAIRADALAPLLLGWTLVRLLPDGTRLAGRIVETEAYLGPDDLASHAKLGHRSPRNESMYGPAGTAYIYFTYGMHHCMNVVCAEPGVPQAVLLRALEPTEAIERMAEHRGHPEGGVTALCSGPGKLCRALGIDRALDGHDLTAAPSRVVGDAGGLWLEPGGIAQGEAVATDRRVGVDSAGPAWAPAALRFFIAGNPHVSVPRGQKPWEPPPRARAPSTRRPER
jgi:DNA-3-methyladenine glycosylase